MCAHACVCSRVCVQYENCFNNHGNPKLEPGHRSHKKMSSWERQREREWESKRGRRARQKIEWRWEVWMLCGNRKRAGRVQEDGKDEDAWRRKERWRWNPGGRRWVQSVRLCGEAGKKPNYSPKTAKSTFIERSHLLFYHNWFSPQMFDVFEPLAQRH